MNNEIFNNKTLKNRNRKFCFNLRYESFQSAIKIYQ